jgi:hypothetical protein
MSQGCQRIEDGGAVRREQARHNASSIMVT